MALAAVLLGLCLGWPARHCPAQHKEGARRFPSLPQIDSIQIRSRFYGFESAVDRDLTGGEPAYDYSVHIIRDGDTYRLYSGGRWRRPGVPHGDGDHVLQHTSRTGESGTWSMPHGHPEFWKGAEEDHTGTWFANNYLEPEVVKVDGTYYMYTQVEIDRGASIDAPGQVAATQADRIQLHTSPDGSNWTRWSAERGVVVNLDQPTRTSLHHQEVIHVPWDEDAKPFWMYVGANVDGRWTGYHRIRSSDPTTFDWQQRESGVSLAQLGNQIGYARQAPGGPLFVRITFTDGGTGRMVPSLQFSRDGVAWFWGDGGPVKLDGSRDEASNRNCYFLGLSTLDGTGELEYLGDSTYRAIYGASTSNGPGHAHIWHSEIGVGELILRIVPAKP